jgi:glyoxylase-like metal-dependent hydrolase (beta-lactamase superfamily II)
MSDTEVHAVRYATRRGMRSEFYLRHESYGEPDAEMSLDYYLWVIRRGDRVVLVDTGFDPEVGRRRGRTCLCPPVEAVARLGVDPASVSHVLVTHLHYDHVGNLGAFPAAELVVPQRELAFWTGPMADRPQFADHVEPGEIAGLARERQLGRVRTFAGRAEVVPGVQAVELGGHSPGQAIVLVETGGAPVVLASDAAHFTEELERGRPFAILADLEAMYRAYDVLNALARERGAIVVPGHDADVMDKFPDSGGDAGGLAVRIA